MLERARQSAAMRIVAVLVLGGFALLNAGADLSRVFGRPIGDYGFQTAGSVVSSVAPGSPAAEMGLRKGDSISLADNSAFVRLAALRGFAPAPGNALRVKVLSPAPKNVVVVAVAESAAHVPYLVSRQILYMLSVVLGAVLLLLRPSVSTWGLFLYSLGAVQAAETILLVSLLGTPLYWPESAFDGLVAAASIFGLVLLCVTLARHSLNRGDKILLGAGALVGLAYGVMYRGQLFPIRGLSFGSANAAAAALTLLAYLLAALALARSFRLAPERFRARMEWIGLGVTLSAAAITTKFVLVSIASPLGVYTFISILDIVPATVLATSAYALLRERIVDVNFVVSRALVYAILTSATIGVLALVDWFVSSRLAQVRLGLLLEVCAAIGLGFALNRMHQWSDEIVDRFVFRSVREAELTLRRLGATLVHAPSRQVIDRIVCSEAAKATSLASAAVFHHTDAKTFARTCSFGWPENAVRRLPAGHQLTLYLMTEERPVAPTNTFDPNELLPQGLAAPVLALPCVVEHQLIAFVLYGSHTSGAEPDVKDIELLRELAERAAAAYEHVEAVSRAEEIHKLKAENEALRAMLRVERV